ncbi:CCA tRNA nucleotidyltransferase [Roseicella frigidaeris]|uniref:CCA tRNA nucleotidyltransferase n=1 Tax=Roseicella frigidaeris TaxID=2230885 RepID=UPI001FB364A0|nr:CCA tRNA nucleotidyltransferase [Roseicella frigidaeris]
MTADPPVARVAPPAFLGRGAPAAVLAALPGARAVGGAVRDALAGRPVHDIDVAAPLPPAAIAARLRAAGLKVAETGLAHGTVTAVLDHEPVEVTSLRRDLATDGRHAEVEWTTDWREDAARRDFTINAMSMSGAGELWDYFGGRADLAAGRVRFVGDPATRLAEDYLRALRFFRFQARYGRGAPDPAAVAAIRAAVPGLARLSAERVWMELKRLLAAPDPRAALALMAETGVLGAVLPEAGRRETLDELVRIMAAAGEDPDPLLRFAALLGDFAALDAIRRRLRPSTAEVRMLQGFGTAEVLADARRTEDVMIRRGDAYGPAADDGDLRRGLYLTAQQARGLDARRLLIRQQWLNQARQRRGDPADWDHLRARIATMAMPEFPLLGRDALEIGLEPGPDLGRWLRGVEAWWLAGGCTADRAACLAHLRELAADPPIR